MHDSHVRLWDNQEYGVRAVPKRYKLPRFHAWVEWSARQHKAINKEYNITKG